MGKGKKRTRKSRTPQPKTFDMKYLQESYGRLYEYFNKNEKEISDEELLKKCEKFLLKLGQVKTICPKDIACRAFLEHQGYYLKYIISPNYQERSKQELSKKIVQLAKTWVEKVSCMSGHEPHKPETDPTFNVLMALLQVLDCCLEIEDKEFSKVVIHKIKQLGGLDNEKIAPLFLPLAIIFLCRDKKYGDKEYDTLLKYIDQCVDIFKNRGIKEFNSIKYYGEVLNNLDIPQNTKDGFKKIITTVLTNNFNDPKYKIPAPSYLFQYTRIADYTESNIRNKQIYLSDFTGFNDPTDPIFKLEYDADCENLLDEIKKIRISCLTQSHTNFLMWSHYADKHQGICIKYKIPEQMPEEYAISPVEYIDKAKLHTPIAFFGPCYPRTKPILENTILKIFSLKHRVWEYEKEYRIFSNSKEFLNLEIEEIYFGFKTCRKCIDKIKDITKTDNIKYYQMKVDPANAFELVAEPLSHLSPKNF